MRNLSRNAIAIFFLISLTILVTGFAVGWRFRTVSDWFLQPVQTVIRMEDSRVVVDGGFVLPFEPNKMGEPEFPVDIWGLDTLTAWLNIHGKRTIVLDGPANAQASIFAQVLEAIARTGRERIVMRVEGKPTLAVDLLPEPRDMFLLGLTRFIDTTHVVLLGGHGMALFETRQSLPLQFESWFPKCRSLDAIADRICRPGSDPRKTSILVNTGASDPTTFGALRDTLERLTHSVSARNRGREIPLRLHAGLWMTQETYSECGPTCGDVSCDTVRKQ